MNQDAVVIGHTGYVGRATALAFAVRDGFSRSNPTLTLDEVNKKQIVYFCLPTPSQKDGSCDTSAITELMTQLMQMPRYRDTTYVIRSTVYVGYADFLMDKFNINSVVSLPEFLSEDTWESDAKNPKMIVIGGRSEKHLERVRGIIRGRYKYSKPIVTDNKTAEHIKYAFNTWFATKVAFSNEHYNFSRLAGTNYETIRTALENHPWGMKNHTIIHYKGKRGIHGNCLPKDTTAFAEASGSPFFKMVMERNATYVE